MTDNGFADESTASASVTGRYPLGEIRPCVPHSPYRIKGRASEGRGEVEAGAGEEEEKKEAGQEVHLTPKPNAELSHRGVAKYIIAIF